MKRLTKYDDADIVWACIRYCEGKYHLKDDFFWGLWSYLSSYSALTEKQRNVVEKFIRRERIDVEKWK